MRVFAYESNPPKEKTLFWEIINHSECFVSTVTVFELYSGAKKESHVEALDTVLSYLEVLSFNHEQAKIASNIFRTLKSKNRLIEFRDIFIASCAMTVNMPLATLNTKHFKRIDGLTLL